MTAGCQKRFCVSFVKSSIDQINFKAKRKIIVTPALSQASQWGHFFRGADLNPEFRENSDGSRRLENEGRGARSPAHSAAPRFHRARRRKQALGVFSPCLPFARKRKRWAGWMRKRNVTSPTGGHFFGVAGSLGKQPFGFFPLLAHVFVNGGTEPFAFDEIFCKRIDDLQGNLKLGGGFFVVAPLFQALTRDQ